MSLKGEVAGLLDSFADLLEFKGENPFKIKAFRNGASAIRNVEGELEPLIKDESIKDIKGIGKGLQSVIYEYYEKGFSSEYDSLISEIPIGITDFFKINGLGAKKIKLLIDELGINSLDELEKAGRENKIAGLKGFGKKTQDSILEEIERINTSRNLVLQNIAEDEISRVINSLKSIEGIKKIEISGEYRRACEVISKIEIIVLVNDIEKFLRDLNNKLSVKDSFTKEISTSNESGNVFYLKYQGSEIESMIFIPVYLYYVSQEGEFTNLLFVTTGSKEFIDNLDLGILERHLYKTENEILTKVNFPYVIPEMREIEYFDAHNDLKGNSDLELEKFQGLLHFHTTASDGKSTLTDMVTTAKEMGFKYTAVCDHSKAAFYAGGLSEDRVLSQKKDIEKTSTLTSIPIFHGIESDILKEGELDYSEDFLKEFDFIVASIHSRFNMNEDEMTNRIIKAVENPNTDLLGHPTGRLLLSRSPYRINLDKIIDACAENNVAIEINANPHRLDLDWRKIYYAREKGCMFSINPDAHVTTGIDDIKYGVRVARKGGLKASEVINCMDLDTFKKYLSRKVNRKIS